MAKTVTAGASQTLISYSPDSVAAFDRGYLPYEITIKNMGPSRAYIHGEGAGSTVAVSPDNGYPLEVGESITFPVPAGVSPTNSTGQVEGEYITAVCDEPNSTTIAAFYSPRGPIEL